MRWFVWNATIGFQHKRSTWHISNCSFCFRRRSCKLDLIWTTLSVVPGIHWTWPLMAWRINSYPNMSELNRDIVLSCLCLNLWFSMVSGVTTIAVDVVCRTFSKQSRCLLVQSASFRQLPAMPVMCREEQATKWLTYLLRLTVTLEGKMVSDVLKILRLWETMGKVKHARNLEQSCRNAGIIESGHVSSGQNSAMLWMSCDVVCHGVHNGKHNGKHNPQPHGKQKMVSKLGPPPGWAWTEFKDSANYFLKTLE